MLDEECVSAKGDLKKVLKCAKSYAAHLQVRLMLWHSFLDIIFPGVSQLRSGVG